MSRLPYTPPRVVKLTKEQVAVFQAHAAACPVCDKAMDAPKNATGAVCEVAAALFREVRAS